MSVRLKPSKQYDKSLASNTSYIESRAEYSESSSSVSKVNYKKLAKKLLKDKETLKERLRKILDDLEQKQFAHRAEMTKMNESLQQEIITIGRDRDRVIEENARLRAEMINEREKVRNYYEAKYKEYRETLHNSNDTQTNRIIENLEQSLQNLQTRLSQYQDEKDQTNNTTEQYYTAQLNQLRQANTDLLDQLTKSREAHAVDRSELSTLKRTFSDQHEQYKSQLSINLSKEFDRLQGERKALESQIEILKQEHQKELTKLRTEWQTKLSQSEYELDRVQKEYARQTADTNKHSSNLFQDLQDKFEQQVATIKHLHAAELKTLDTEWRQKFDQTVQHHEKLYTNKIRDMSASITELTKINTRLTKENEYLNEQTFVFTNDKIEQYKKKFATELEQLQNIYEGKLVEKTREITDLKTRYDQQVKELTNTYLSCRAELETVQKTLKNMHVHSESTYNQYIDHLNTQRDEYEQRIGELEQSLKKVMEQAIDQSNLMERRIKMVQEELVEMTAKYEASKTMI